MIRYRFAGDPSWQDLLAVASVGGNVNADWTATSGPSQILNKPTLGTAAYASASDFAAGTSVLLKSGGIMQGEIAMSNNRITGLATPTAAADAATKNYVDNAYVVTANGVAPSWETLRNASWGSSGWGDDWVVDNGTYKVNGIAACFGTASKSGNNPSSFGYGQHCWCKVNSVNNVQVSGAWSFNYTTPTFSDCNAVCSSSCANCIRNAAVNSCTAAALFSAY
jgi:hypothetical protein